MKGSWAKDLIKGLTRKQVVIPLVLLMLLVVIFFILQHPDPIQNMHDYLQFHVSPHVFLLLMMVLPIVGAPLSVFLLLVGMKFGIAGGIFFTAVLMAIHMVCTYYIIHSFLRGWIINLLTVLNLPFPAQRLNPSRWQLFLFTLVPGLPYTVKNNLLALSGIPFRTYLLINWTSQFFLSIPRVLAGTAIIELDPLIIAVAIFLLFIVFVLQRYAKQKYKKAREKRSKNKINENV